MPYPAALDPPHALVEAVTMLIVTREGDRHCTFRPSGRALITLAYLRRHDTPGPTRRGIPGLSEPLSSCVVAGHEGVYGLDGAADAAGCAAGFAECSPGLQSSEGAFAWGA